MAEADASQKGSVAEDAADPITGQVLNGRFSILEPIGTGGMGKVYRAVQAPLDRMVAVKVLHPHYANNKDPGFVRRFVLEASLTSKLRHPNTVTVIDYGQTEDGIFYLAMELLEGETLAQLLQREGALPWSRALFIGAQICRSLREAHKLGVLHRDLKPGNVMLLEESDHDVVKVLDFGLVKSFMAEDEALAGATAANDPDQVGKITQAGMLLGSPQYMSPEQARGDSDPRSDVYSFGVLLYEMLTGRAPFTAKDYLDVIVKHLKEAPIAPSAAQPGLNIPPEVEAVVMRCLAKAPEERFQSMDEVLDAIRMASGVGGLTESFQLSHVRATGAGLPALGRGPTPPPNLSVTGQILPPQGFSLDDGSTLFGAKEPSSKPIGFALLALLAVVGGFGYWYLEREAEPAVVESPSTVTFTVVTDPPGVQVFDGETLLGTSPVSFERAPEDEDGLAAAELRLVLDGYLDAEVSAGGSGTVMVRRTMEKRPAPRRAVAARGAVVSVGANAGAAGGSTGASGETKVDEEIELAYDDDLRFEAPTMLGALPPAPPDASPVGAPSGSGGLAGVADDDGGEEVVPFGQGMTRPELVNRGKRLRYTREALEAKIEGTMIFKCVISVAGKLENCRTIKPLPFMEEAVLETLYSRRYRPVTYQGKPVAVDYVFQVKLALPN